MKHYYLVGGTKHQSALNAWQDIKTSGDKAYELVLDEGRFENYNWLLQPGSSVEALENKRAVELRNKHDRLRLLYSGGSDSYSVAHAFARNKIPVDEYLMYEWTMYNPELMDSTSFTAMKTSWLVDLHKQYNLPPPNITLLTIDQKILEQYFSSNWFTSHAGYAGTQSFNINHIGDMVSLAPTVPGTVDVLGMEKPRVFSDGKVVWFEMNDKNTLYGAGQYNDYEWFYLSADACELVNAQCRGTIQVARAMFGHLSLPLALQALQTDARYYNDWCLAIGRKSSRFQNLMSKLSKNVGVSETNYIHIVQYKQSTSGAWKNYLAFLDTAVQIHGVMDPVGIITKRYILEK